LDEYQSGEGEYAGGFGEYEFGAYQPQHLTQPCPPYAPGEVAKSRTDAGHLPSDVFAQPEQVLIADFGVDWRHTKPGLARDATLKAWLTGVIARMRTDPRVGLSIIGFSDCVGRENNNMFLRRGRALRVKQLLLQLASPADRSFLNSRISSADAASPGEFIADNGTIAGRARNRGVLVMTSEIITITGP
jgi:outer membrane protein OmpA-like peptidoglycan-associated protein